MPVPSETEPGRAGLPVIDLATARELFRTAESSGLGRPGTDEIFDQWLNDSCDIAFYRGADRPLQARAVDTRDEVPEWLSNSRAGQARLEAVCLNPYRAAPAPSEEPAPAFADAGAVEVEETDACTWEGMPGLCWHCEADQERYAKVDERRAHAGVDDDGYVLELVAAYAGGIGEDPSYALSGEFPPDFHAWSLRSLTVLTEVAQLKLNAESWNAAGSWHLVWHFCENDATNPLDETEDIDCSYDDLDGESSEFRCHVSVENNGDAPTVQVVGTRAGSQHVMYRAHVLEPDGESQDPGTLEGLRSLLERATEQVHREAGYKVEGEWTVDWSRCHILLAD
ncbi:hypothetical protein ACFU53_07630 [Streptomyces sp. NPDC057474]|uniref:hypothetical protein n=1 Tax=Streptomyces sp. NPDC057474 TaxID=3346144 RepID=UPI0036B1DDA4